MRRLLVVLVGFAVLVLGFSSPVLAATERTITMAASESAVVQDSNVEFTGTLSSSPTGSAVHLQRRSGLIWTNVATTSSGTAGAFSITHTVASKSGRYAYRAYAPSTSTLQSAYSPVVNVDVLKPVSIDATMSPEFPKAGDTLSFTGVATPARRYSTVELQRQTDRGWQTVATTKAGSAGGSEGQFAFTQAAPEGVWSYRILKPRDGYYASATSPELVGPGQLQVEIINVPPGSAARVQVTDPNHTDTRITGSTKFNPARAGTWIVTADTIETETSAVSATKPFQFVGVKRGQAHVIVVDYSVTTTGDWKSTTAGARHSCGVKTDGTAWCWGDTTDSGVEDGGSNYGPKPVRVGSSSNWKALTAGSYHTCGLRLDGTAWCWGANDNGALGDGTRTDRVNPVRVGTSKNWKSLDAGWGHTCGVRNDGTAWCWGGNWGAQVGDGTKTNRAKPTRVGSGTDWKSVTAGGSHTCGTRADGNAWCWGFNSSGQMGDGSTTSRPKPSRIGTESLWTSLTAGVDHTCGARKDGTAWCWGNNSMGQLGDGTTTFRSTPRQVGSSANWMSLSAGGGHSCGLRSDGAAWCWGANHFGQVGDDGDTPFPRTSPTRVALDKGWASLTGGASHACGVRANHTTWCWGANGTGQLGDETTTDRWKPGLVGIRGL